LDPGSICIAVVALVVGAILARLTLDVHDGTWQFYAAGFAVAATWVTAYAIAPTRPAGTSGPGPNPRIKLHLHGLVDVVTPSDPVERTWGRLRSEEAAMDVHDTNLRTRPARECDVVMKGGITSGVLYPTALAAIGRKYRIRGIGGASAGAIGAALGAAAEYGRASGGYERLLELPDDLGGGKLAALFQPQPETRQLLRLMLAATGNERPASPGELEVPRSRVRPVVGALLRAFPVASVVGALPGVALIVLGVVGQGWSGVLLVIAGIPIAIVGVVAALFVRLWQKFTVAVPKNLFGICRGVRVGDKAGPGFTDWLAGRIDEIAGLDAAARPLRFGHLWTGSEEITSVAEPDRANDLRMITTCLSEGRPYELPWDANRFFYEPEVWETLFPTDVMQALDSAPTGPTDAPEETTTSNTSDVSDESDDAGDEAESASLNWEDDLASAHTPRLRRLPSDEHLPVVVATRMSLSFPLLISAVPLWVIDRRADGTKDAQADYRKAMKAGQEPPTEGLVFRRVWFTDGGFCSNFPVQMFDAAMPSRPTFAINLGRFSADQKPSDDEADNVEIARSNSSGLLPSLSDIPDRGVAAVAGFASAALNTARNWTDSTHLDHPGYRDRIVRILQTKREGGLNLYMDTPTITRLAQRGRAAGETITDQFTELRYPVKTPRATGWDNHRWVRYRALLSALPAWARSYKEGMAVFDLDPAKPPSYRFSAKGRHLSSDLTKALDDLAQVVTEADEAALDDVTSKPRPLGAIRRVPQI
jgi:predicted acylesterase/phospholipase RssA